MDMLQRAEIDRQTARASSRARPSAAIPVLVMLAVVDLPALYFSPIIGAVIMGAAGLALMMVWVRAARNDDGDELQGDPLPEAQTPRREISHGTFVALGGVPSSLLPRMKPPEPPPVVVEPIAEPEPYVETPRDSFELFRRSEPYEIVAAEIARLRALVSSTQQQRIGPLEPLLAARLHKNRQQELLSFLSAKDIVAALNRRIAELNRHVRDCGSTGSDDEWMQRAWQLCFGKLEIQADPLSSITGQTERLNLTAIECEKKLDSIFQQLMRRKTFHQALQPPEV